MEASRPGAVAALAWWQAGVALSFGLLYFATRRGRLPVARAHVAGLIIVLAISLDGVLHLRWMTSLSETTTFMFIVLGIAFFFSRSTWMLAAEAAAIAAWVVGIKLSATGLRPHVELMGIPFVIALLLAGVIHVARRRTLHRVEELRLREELLLDRLRFKNSELEQFAGRVSHDLRSPLSVLKLDVATSVPGPARVRAERAVDRMDALITDLLDLSRASSQDVRGTLVDVSSLARAVVDDRVASDPDRDLTAIVDPGIKVWGDHGLIQVLLENLLGNAWKFTASTPEARIEVRHLPGGFLVRDNGPGLDENDSERIFEAFERGQTGVQGTGVGLATVRRIVDRHGGHIRVRAAPGKGATFEVFLPRHVTRA